LEVEQEVVEHHVLVVEVLEVIGLLVMDQVHLEVLRYLD
jgi:hypothetical protein